MARLVTGQDWSLYGLVGSAHAALAVPPAVWPVVLVVTAGLATWLIAGFAVGVLVGRAVRRRDRQRAVRDP
jgi:hypothetical protein